jgi:hypothetical protein
MVESFLAHFSISLGFKTGLFGERRKASSYGGHELVGSITNLRHWECKIQLQDERRMMHHTYMSAVRTSTLRRKIPLCRPLFSLAGS